MSKQHKPTCQREIMRHADDSAAYLSERCTCDRAPAEPPPWRPTGESVAMDWGAGESWTATREAPAEPLTDYNFDVEAKRLIDAIEPRRGATMTVICALHEAYEAGRAAHATQQAALRALVERMRHSRHRWQVNYGGSDAVFANVVDEWADEVARLLGAE